MSTQLIKTAKDACDQNGRFRRCGATIDTRDVVEPRKKNVVTNDEEGESATWDIWRRLFGEQPRYRDFAIPLVMIAVATGVLWAIIPGSSVLGMSRLVTVAAAVGFLVMWGQSELLGTDFGPLGAAVVKVVAVTLFPMSLLAVQSLLAVLVEAPAVPVILLLCLPVIPIIFYGLTQWLFDLEYFETFLFCVALTVVFNLLALFLASYWPLLKALTFAMRL